MKKYLILFFCIAITVACGRAKNNNNTDTHAGHDHAPGVECNAGKTAVKKAPHVHADGEECTGDHNHEGDDHATPHVHADGVECTDDHSHDGHDHGENNETPHVHVDGEECADGHDHDSENPDEIVFPAEQAARTDFKVEQVVLSTFTDVIKTSGRVLPAQGQEVTLAAPISGIVSFAGSNLSEGMQVGVQNLFYISTKNIGTGDVAAKTAAAYRKAKADYERAEKLLVDKIVSQREFEAITSEYMQAKTEYDALAGSQTDRGTRVTSPIAGYIANLSVNEGDFVEMGQTLVTVSQNRRLVLRAEVSQRYYSRLGSVKNANFTSPYDNTTYLLTEMGGKLLSVGQSSMANTSLVPVTFEFNNNGSVVPGSYVEVYLLGSPVANAITLPKTAITEQQGLYYVFVQIDRDCYERREVMLGADNGDRVRILSGIHAGERVVTRGAINVKLAGASGAIPHGHEH